MDTKRLEAFSDGVIAILITIIILEFHAPEQPTLASLHHLLPLFLVYILSFVHIGLYWNNHHHMLAAAEHANGKVLWANHHLLFWLSLVPFTTAWMGRNHFEPAPVALYGAVMLGSSMAYFILQRALIGVDGRGSALKQAVGGDYKGKLSPIIYVVAIGLAFVEPKVSLGMYVVVALMWFIPDSRIEKKIEHQEDERARHEQDRAPRKASSSRPTRK